MAEHLPELFQRIRVPTAIYYGEKEVEKVFDAPFIQSLINVMPGSLNEKQLRLFPGDGERHTITRNRLDALRQWFVPFDQNA